jgi:predicted nucleic acid-binding protein
MATGKSRFYWETSVFISWLKGGVDRTPEEMQGIEITANKMAVGRVQLVTSVITEIEVLESKFTKEQQEKIKVVLRNPNNCIQVNVDPMIAHLAKSYREKFGLKTPDAIHLATAIRAKCEEFHGFDDHHLELNEKQEFSGLIIRKPPFDAPLFETFYPSALPEFNGGEDKEESDG